MKTISSLFRTLNITSTLLATVVLAAPMTILAQGVLHRPGGVVFQNTESQKAGVSSHLVTNSDNTLLVGTQYQAELYYLDTTTSLLTPMPTTVSSFKGSTTSSPGTWNGPKPTGPNPTVALPEGYGGVDFWDDGSGEVGDGSGTGPGYYPVTLRVRVWDSTTGSTWEVATTRGESPSFMYTQRSLLIPSDVLMITQPGFQLQSASQPPGIAVQPRGQSGYWGKSVSFNVVAYGSTPLSYQWLKDGSAIPGATQIMLNLTNLDLSAGGNYSVVVSNSVGSVTSNPAFLLLNAAGISLGLYPGLTIDGVVGNTYGIQYTTNLIQSSSWTTLTNLTLTQPVELWVDTSADAMAGSAPRRSYRVVAVP